MAFPAKDGSKHTNVDSAKRADAKHMAKQPAAPKQPAQQMGGEPDMDDMQEDGSAIAQQNGPAHMVEINHDHQQNIHHVMSQHPNGFVHESDHPDVESAHKHAHKLAGGAAAHAEPDGDEAY